MLHKKYNNTSKTTQNNGEIYMNDDYFVMVQ